MRFSDIKVGHVYNCIFDPVRECEFNGRHLAAVLKKNNDNQTFIVMPLTTSSSGDTINKKRIGRIETLPSSLNKLETYAVFNQIRTLNASRFIALKEGQRRVDVVLDEDVFQDLFIIGINELLFNVRQEDKIKLLKNMYGYSSIVKAKDLAYEIKKLNRAGSQEVNKQKIDVLKANIKDILIGINYDNLLDQKYVNDGIKSIFDEATK